MTGRNAVKTPSLTLLLSLSFAGVCLAEGQDVRSEESLSQADGFSELCSGVSLGLGVQ